MNLGLPDAGYCSEACLAADWETHKVRHEKRNEGSFSYTGSLRPHAYPTAGLRPVPEGIAKPEWAKTGAPDLVTTVTAQSTIPRALTIDVQKVKVASKICRDALDAGHRAIKAGVTTDEIDRVVHEYIVSRGAYPSLLNHHQFRGSCTTSINEAIAQGVPDERPLEDGDMITVGVSCYKDGYFSDIAETYCVGQVDEQGRKLAETSRQALMKAVELCGPGRRWADVGISVASVAEPAGFSVVRNFTGHGLGKLFRQAPDLPHHAGSDIGGVMQPGHIFTIEPIITEGRHENVVWPDTWTTATKDGKRSAQFRHTVLITDKGHLVLTDRTSSSPSLNFGTDKKKV